MNLRVYFSTNVGSSGKGPMFAFAAQQPKKVSPKKESPVSFKQVDIALEKVLAIYDKKEGEVTITRDDTLYIHALENDPKFAALVEVSYNTKHTYTTFMKYRSEAIGAYSSALEPLTDALWTRVASENAPIQNKLRSALENLIKIVNSAYAARSMLEQFKNAPFYDKKNDSEYQKQHDYISKVISRAEGARNYINGLIH